MNKTILTLAALFFYACAHGQYYGLWEKRDSSQFYVFADKAYVRADTSVTATILDSLYAGDDILVLKSMDAVLGMNGITAPWLKISYNKAGLAKQGYIWSPLLSFTPLRRGDTKFIYGIEKMVSKDTVSKEGKYTMRWYVVKLKVVQNDKVQAQTTFRVGFGEGSSLAETQISGGRKLLNVLYMPSVTFAGGACGVGSTTYTHTWNGKELYALPVLYGEGDADVHYYTETFIFPADRAGRPNTVILRTVQGDATDKLDKQGNMIYKVSRKQKLYTWDGHKLVSQ